jgi:hypothetical protein
VKVATTPVGRVEEALAVGSDDADAGLPGHRGQPLLQRHALRADLGEAGGVDDRRPRADRGGLPDRVLHPVGRDQHEHQVDRARDVGQRRVAAPADQFLVVRVDRVDAALVPVLDQVAQRPGHQVLRPARDAEQRDPPRSQQRLQTAVLRVRRRHGHRAARLLGGTTAELDSS